VCAGAGLRTLFKHWFDNHRAFERPSFAQINPKVDHYFSQYDLLASGGKFEVGGFWKDVPLDGMKDVLNKQNTPVGV